MCGYACVCVLKLSIGVLGDYSTRSLKCAGYSSAAHQGDQVGDGSGIGVDAKYCRVPTHQGVCHNGIVGACLVCICGHDSEEDRSRCYILKQLSIVAHLTSKRG